MYLHFWYPSAYIDKQFRKVLGDCICSTSIIPVIANAYKFIQLRRKLMGQPTARQSQLEAQIAQSKLDNDAFNEEQTIQRATAISATHQKQKNHKIISSYIILMKIDLYQ